MQLQPVACKPFRDVDCCAAVAVTLSGRAFQTRHAKVMARPAAMTVVDVDSSPIKPGIDGTVIKTFEQLLNEKLAKQQENLPEVGKEVVKRAFLRKGSGLTRFQPKNLDPAEDKDGSIELVQKTNQRKPVVFIHNNSFKVKEVKKQVERHLVKDPEIKDLKDLLNKIELRKTQLQENINLINEWEDISGEESEKENLKLKPKKIKCRKKGKSSLKSYQKLDKNNVQEDLSLIHPTTSAFTLSLQHQIVDLQKRIQSLKTDDKDDLVEEKRHSNSSCESDFLSQFEAKIESLNNRLKNMEYHQYKSTASQMNLPVKQKKKSTKSGVTHHQKEFELTKGDGYQVFNFSNGDKMKVLDDHTTFYTYSNGITQTSYPDGLQVIQFPEGQVEKIHKSGVKQIFYTNGVQRTINPDGSEEVHTSDGTTLRVFPDGTESVDFANGDREIRTRSYQRREYNNGTVKTLYSDGTQETRYKNGRLRIKDKFGNLIVDSQMKHLSEFET